MLRPLIVVLLLQVGRHFVQTVAVWSFAIRPSPVSVDEDLAVRLTSPSKLRLLFSNLGASSLNDRRLVTRPQIPKSIDYLLANANSIPYIGTPATSWVSDIAFHGRG